MQNKYEKNMVMNNVIMLLTYIIDSNMFRKMIHNFHV
jgi:hypothetical protein